MDDKKTKYRKEYHLKNKEKLIEYGKKYYLTRINPTVEITIVHGEFILFLDKIIFAYFANVANHVKK